MRRALFVSAVLVCMSAASERASAQLLAIGFGGGMIVPTSDAAKVLKSGINGQAYVLLGPLRFNLGYQKFDFKDQLLNTPGGQFTGTGTNTMLSGVLGLSINLIHIGPVTPYVTAGVGEFNVKNEFTPTGGTSTSASSSQYGIDGGGGLKLKFGHLSGFVEGLVQNVYTSDKKFINTHTISAIPVTFGIQLGL